MKWLSLVGFFVTLVSAKYEPNGQLENSRPLPKWYDEGKIGIFLHWGLYSVPSFGSEWFWRYRQLEWPSYVKFMNDNYKPNFTYADFAPMFTAEFYNPKLWADIFYASGARYVVLTSKHHEGYTMWPSKYSWNWNAKDVGPKRDLLGDLAKAIRQYNPTMKFGVYHLMEEWFHPLYLRDRRKEFKTRDFAERKVLPELHELVNIYKPEYIWFDGGSKAPDTYWNSRGFFAWLYKHSSVKDTVVVKHKWTLDTSLHHGSYFSDDSNLGKLQPKKWEKIITIYKSTWGYRREVNLSDIMTTEELISNVAKTVSCGGNILINVGPTHDGRIDHIFEERLRQLGSWLNINGEAIYKSSSWTHQNDSVSRDVWYTTARGNVYAIILKWPRNKIVITLGSIRLKDEAVIRMVGYDEKLKWKPAEDKGIEVSLPLLTPDLLFNPYAWVLKMAAKDVY